jgi:hypothetical protein
MGAMPNGNGASPTRREDGRGLLYRQAQDGVCAAVGASGGVFAELSVQLSAVVKFRSNEKFFKSD